MVGSDYFCLELISGGLGVNTGFGGSADIRTKRLIELQQALVRELHYGILPAGERDHRPGPLDEVLAKDRQDLSLESGLEATYLPRSWARASILIRINSLISGCSAVRPVIVQRMQDLLTHDIIPMIPLRGSISSSGDLSPLSYICGAIQGKSTIRVLASDNQHFYADSAFTTAGLEPVVIEAKEGLAMTNGTAVSAAVAALALHDTHSLALLAQVLTAMSVEALTGTVESFHPFLSAVRPHRGQVSVLFNLPSGTLLTSVEGGICPEHPGVLSRLEAHPSQRRRSLLASPGSILHPDRTTMAGSHLGRSEPRPPSSLH